MTSFRFFLLTALLIRFSDTFSQNENKVWYFGSAAGLDFNTSPPTILTNGAMSTSEGCASIANSSGSLLFYTDGTKVIDNSHAIMANGNGLFGSPSSSQSGVIVKRPGSTTLYYVFTTGAGGGALNYSEVDMTLAAGLGSVTTKNTLLSPYVTEHLTSVRHCNGIDIWVLAHEYNSITFRAYLVTASGVNPVSVNSTVGAGFQTFFIGCMKASPNGKKLGFAVAGSNSIEVFDFDASTGVISNPLTLNGTITYPYGVEFSPDCTKLYVKGHYQLGQWDLCAGSGTLIAASVTTFVTVNGIGSLQLAPNGKIYVARQSQPDLGVVNNPNVSGTGCNYNDLGQSVAPKLSAAGLPNFITSGFKALPPPFTYTTTCNTATFSPVSATFCPGVTYSVTNIQWNFGDPSSGALNSSSVNNPSHTFSGPGTYTTQLIFYYSCGGASDTLNQTVNVINAGPTLTVAGNFTICQSEKRTYTVTGASSYSWNNGSTASTISVGPAASTATYTVVGTGTNTCASQKKFVVTVNKCTSIFDEASASESFKIYPNPATDLLQIENRDKTVIIILNLQGMILLKEEYESGHHQLDLTSIASGFYYMKIITEKRALTRSFVKKEE